MDVVKPDLPRRGGAHLAPAPRAGPRARPPRHRSPRPVRGNPHRRAPWGAGVAARPAHISNAR